jgi:splicing factor U2AF subunit
VNPNQLRQARRIYVGNLPPRALYEDVIIPFFNNAMLRAKKTGVEGRPPVVGVQINVEKSYAFLEFEHSKICNECMGFDGIVFDGNTLKLRRPKDYIPLPQSYREEPFLEGDRGGGVQQSSDGCSTIVPDGPNKVSFFFSFFFFFLFFFFFNPLQVFGGAIPMHLTEAQVKELLSSFGQLKGKLN